MTNNNIEIQEKIKKEFLISNKRRNIKKGRNIKIPSGINLAIEGNSVKMKLSIITVCSNMQKDDGAFEGWAMVLKRWGKYEKIIISWDKPQLSDKNGHYQRFLFRVEKFSLDFNTWFSIDRECQIILLDDLKIKDGVKYFLNMPNNRSYKESLSREAILENQFVTGVLRKPLDEISKAVFIDRQLPVGVFENTVSKTTSIFTGGKSAIDIWGFNEENELLVFELKADKNEKVGIISELYLYVSVLQNLRKNVFGYKNCLDKNNHLLKIPETKKIKAYFLTPMLHPLIDRQILRLLNEVAPDEISYHYIQYNQETKKLTLDTFN